MRGIADDGALIYFEDQRTPRRLTCWAMWWWSNRHDEVLVKRLLRGPNPALTIWKAWPADA